MNKFAALAAIAALSPSPAMAAPVFLKCSLVDRGGESVFDIQLNEEAGTVSYFIHRSETTVKARAIFTPNMVSFGPFEINRRDLTFRRDNTGGGFYTPGQTPPVDEGKCEISETDRAF